MALDRILITGGLGFLGRNLAGHFVKKGHEVIVLSRSDRNLHEVTFSKDLKDLVFGDAEDEDLLKKVSKGCDQIIHCAALVGAEYYSNEPVTTMRTEVRTLHSVCSAALENKIKKVLYPSSSAVYGGGLKVDESFSESSTLNLVSSYAIVKRHNELLLRSYKEQYGLSSAALRIFNVYGPGQDDRLVIPRFINKALRNENITINGDGSQVRDFVYIDDVVAAFDLCSKDEVGEGIYNIGTGQGTSISDIAKRVIGETDSSSSIVNQPVDKSRLKVEVDRSVGNINQLKEDLGFKVKTDLATGIQKTIDYCRSKV